MQKYKKLPVTVEALKWNGSHDTYIELRKMGCPCQLEQINDVQILRIGTLEGVMTVNIDDYVIKGIKEEFYSCKPDIFKATYELVE